MFASPNLRCFAFAVLVLLAPVGARAATVIACQDSTQADYPASPLHPCPTTTTPSATTPVAGAQYGLTVASATTLTVPATAREANVTVEGEPVRCTTDGATTPTASVGSLYQTGTLIQVWLTAMSNLKCIQTTATATLDVEYFK